MISNSLNFTLILSVFCLISLNLFAQGTSPATPSNTITVPAQVPVNPSPSVPDQSAFPTYTVTPSEDLNPYGLSSLENSTEKDFRNEPGTFGTNTKRTTNAEVNKRIKDKKKAEENPEEERAGAVEDSPEITSPEKRYESENKASASSADYKKTKLIRWTDDQGNVHITNDIGNVPQRFLDSIEYK